LLLVVYARNGVRVNKETTRKKFEA
jgi:hypothetical protein